MSTLIWIFVVAAILYVAIGAGLVFVQSKSGMGAKPTMIEAVKAALTWYKYFV
jgi:hypothetical protein